MLWRSTDHWSTVLFKTSSKQLLVQAQDQEPIKVPSNSIKQSTTVDFWPSRPTFSFHNYNIQIYNWLINFFFDCRQSQLFNDPFAVFWKLRLVLFQIFMNSISSTSFSHLLWMKQPRMRFIVFPRDFFGLQMEPGLAPKISDRKCFRLAPKPFVL